MRCGASCLCTNVELWVGVGMDPTYTTGGHLLGRRFFFREEKSTATLQESRRMNTAVEAQKIAPHTKEFVCKGLTQ